LRKKVERFKIQPLTRNQVSFSIRIVYVCALINVDGRLRCLAL
jgi:hypothetical protein